MVWEGFSRKADPYPDLAAEAWLSILPDVLHELFNGRDGIVARMDGNPTNLVPVVRLTTRFDVADGPHERNAERTGGLVFGTKRQVDSVLTIIGEDTEHH